MAITQLLPAADDDTDIDAGASRRNAVMPGAISAGVDRMRAGAFGNEASAPKFIASPLAATNQTARPRRNTAAGGNFEYGNSTRSIDPKISARASPATGAAAVGNGDSAAVKSFCPKRNTGGSGLASAGATGVEASGASSTPAAATAAASLCGTAAGVASATAMGLAAFAGCGVSATIGTGA